VQWPTAATNVIELGWYVYDILSGSPVVDVEGRVCRRDDAACAEPLAVEQSDAKGTFRTSVPVGVEGFRGFGMLNKQGYVPTLVFVGKPLVASSVGDLDFRGALSTSDTVDVLYGQLDIVRDPARAIVGFVTFDCEGQPAAGLEVELDEADASTVRYYASNVLPDPALAETGPEGGVLFFNAPAGPLHVTVREAGTGLVVARDDLLAVAGGFSFMQVSPTP